MERGERYGIADRAIAVGFWFNAVLMVVKLLAGHFGRSEAVFADGVESAGDFVAILGSLIALRVGRKPLDEAHPYGHGKSESIAAVGVSLLILAAGAGILYQAAHTILDGRLVRPHLLAVAVAALTIAAKEGLFRYTRTVSRSLGSPAIEAIARDHRKDALTSLATLAGAGGAYLGVPVLDPLAAVLSAGVIFYIGGKTLRDAAHDLMDGRPPREWIAEVTRIAATVEGVEHVHEIRGRRSGQYLIVDLKLEMDPAMTVRTSHDIATRVKRRIFEALPEVGDVMIHVNPHDDGNHEDLTRL